MLLMECPQYIGREEALHFSSAVQSCPTLCDPMHCTPGFPVHHQHLGLVQIHVHRVGDAIQPSHLALASGSLGCAAGPLCLSQDMTHTEYAVAICYWPSVYRQFNGKLNVVLIMYSLLI